MSMFWGLPMRVSAEPMLAAQARARKKGRGFSPLRMHPRPSTGVMARQTTSLVRRADSTPDTRITAPRSAPGETGRPAMRRETSE